MVEPPQSLKQTSPGEDHCHSVDEAPPVFDLRPRRKRRTSNFDLRSSKAKKENDTIWKPRFSCRTMSTTDCVRDDRHLKYVSVGKQNRIFKMKVFFEARNYQCEAGGDLRTCLRLRGSSMEGFTTFGIVERRFADMPCIKRVYRDKKAPFHWSAARKKARSSSP